MKFKINSKYVKWGITAFFVIAAAICFYYVVFHMTDIVRNVKSLSRVTTPIICGLIIAYLMTPILNSFEKGLLNPLFDKMKIKPSVKREKIIRALSILLTVVLVFFILYAIIAMLISQIVPSIRAIISNFDTYVDNVSAWLDKLLENNPDLKNYVVPQVSKASAELEKWLEDTATLLAKSSEILKTVSLSIISFVKATWNFIIGFIISIYVLASKETFSDQSKKMLYALFQTDAANSILKSFRFIHRTFIGFISGKVLDSIIIGLLCFIGTTIMNTPYAILVSVIVGVTNVIPFFGPYLGAIPSALLILIVDITHPLNCVYFVLFIFLLQQFDGNILGPKILGDSTGLSGFWVIFSITLFGGLFGIPGMIVGVPIFAIIYAAIKKIINHNLEKKKLPTDSASYNDMECVDKDGNFLPRVPAEPKIKKHKSTYALIKEKLTEKKETEPTETGEPKATEKEKAPAEEKPDESVNEDEK